MKAVAVPLLLGNKLHKCTIALCTPGPPKALIDRAGINIGKFGTLLTAKRKQPMEMNNIDITEHTRGPYESKIAPSSKGPKKLKKEAVTNMICI
jgi:hypothetical protein